MPHKTFGRAKHDENEIAPEPVTFDLGDEENLGVRSRVNGKLLLRVMSQVESGDVGKQADGLISVFGLVMLRDDGSDPEGFSGKEFDPEKPHKNHTPTELRELAEESVTPGIDPTSSLGRLNRVLDDPDTEIDIADLAELVGWLVSELTGNQSRPTKSASGSGSSGRNTKATSTRKRQPRVLTPVDSTSD